MPSAQNPFLSVAGGAWHFSPIRAPPQHSAPLLACSLPQHTYSFSHLLFSLVRTLSLQIFLGQQLLILQVKCHLP